MRNWHRYAPSLLVLAVAIAVLFAGPLLIDRLLHARERAVTRIARMELASDPLLGQLNAAFENIARAVEPSVVHITVSRQGRDNLFSTGYSAKQGSGWVYDSLGHIVTNHHVIEDANAIEVRFSDGMPHRAVVVGSDAQTDIAVLRVDSRQVVPIDRATGSRVNQGDFVFAFGSPFGFEFSMSSGIISGQSRQARLDVGGYENYIQTDAAINPGNSGGPLVNVYGQLVGMNIAIAVDPQDPVRGGRFTGVGLAIPLDMIEFVVEQLITGQSVRRGGLGANLDNIGELDPALRRRLDLPTTGAILKELLEGGPAQQSGLQQWDLVTAINGQPVTNADAFRTQIHNLPPDAQVRFKVWRAPDWVDIDVVLGDWSRINALYTLQEFGLGVEEMSEEQRTDLVIPPGVGVWIASIIPDGRADTMGIKAQRAVTTISGRPVKSIEVFAATLSVLQPGQKTTLTLIDQAGKPEAIEITMPFESRR